MVPCKQCMTKLIKNLLIAFFSLCFEQRCVDFNNVIMLTKEMLPHKAGGACALFQAEEMRLGVVGLWVSNMHHFEMSVHPACPAFLTTTTTMTTLNCTQIIVILQVVKY